MTLTPHQQAILELLVDGPLPSGAIVEATGRAGNAIWETLRRLEARGYVEEYGRVQMSRTRPQVVWALAATDDARDVVCWMADALDRGDPRSAEEYAEDIGIAVSTARRRMAHARRLGWLDGCDPTPAGTEAVRPHQEHPP